MSFGGETIDSLGVTRSFPSLSMLTGLFANALGLRRVDREAHQRLQDRLVFAARIDREPAGDTRLRDFQTVQLRANDRGWTTHGVPQGRTGGAATYDSSHLRHRITLQICALQLLSVWSPMTSRPHWRGLRRHYTSQRDPYS